MSATPASVAALGGSPLTKFRAPRARRDIVLRGALLARFAQSAWGNPVTLLCAPGGSGKTTLLTQFAAEQPRDAAVVWISVDEEDNDANRLFATVVQALHDLNLTWETDPRALMAGITGTAPQVRAALAALVNALCTSAARRIAIVFDDFHRVGNPAALALVESLVERLPAHVALVLGTRVEPQLPLARWRVHGELGEFSPEDLKFSEQEAAALALARFGEVPDQKTLRTALLRTHGWAVGLTMALQARASGEPESRKSRTFTPESYDRHLFAYLAQEILEELPQDLREFALKCSLLDELSPTLCEAVTGRTDAGAVLQELFRRNLFLTALDESTPVLRFHDLFRDFLESELQRRYAGELEQLHERAARAETVTTRAIHHFVKARGWPDAIRLILSVGESLLAEGGVATLERWIDQLPDEQRSTNPELSYLRGACAWLRWDWVKTKRELVPAIAGLTEPRQIPMRVRALFSLTDALNSSGESQTAWERLEEVSRLPLDGLGQAYLAMARAWCLAPSGDEEAVSRYMREFIAHAEKDPAAICPPAAPRVHCIIIGLPGVADCFQRYFELCELIRTPNVAPWQVSAVAVGGWAHFWRGRRIETQAAVERSEVLLHQFGGIRVVAERVAQLKALYNAATGNLALAIATAQAHIEGLHAPEVARHSAVWLRSYRHALARMYWIAGDAAGFFAAMPPLLAPRAAGEWPFTDTAAEVVRGQAAILSQDWRAAEIAAERACSGFMRHRLPLIHADPRLHLAYAQLMLGKREQAWNTFEAALQELVREQAVGALSLELVPLVQALIDLIPADVRRSDDVASLLEHYARWRGVALQAEANLGPLDVLSEREREVLGQVAGGSSNKHIARALALSLHTVKRHIANILDKLECDSRGQAADLYRRHA